jgi:cytochrome c-type biogenesis protein CcmH
MIAGVVARAREAIAGAGDAPAPDVTAAHEAATDDGDAPGVTINVRLPDGAEADPGDTLFVLARSAASGSRMPIAVQRLTVGQLPLQLRLDDSSSMAGQKLSEAGEVVLVAQVSPDGRPGQATATWVAQSGPVVPSVAGDAVELLLAPNTP